MSDPAPGRSASIDDVSHFVLRTGRLLLVTGADADHVRRRLEELAASLGVSAELFISGERLLLTVSSNTSYRTRIGRPIVGMGVDIGRYAALEEIAGEVAAGRVDLTEAGRRLDALEAAPGLHPEWLVVLGVAGTAAALARLFGAEWVVVLGAFVAGVANILLRRRFAAKGVNPVAAAFATAFLSGLLGALVLTVAPGAAAALCLAAAGMILVPCVPLINGVSDMAAGHAGIGLSRLVTGTVTVLAVGFALFLAAVVAGDPLPVALHIVPIPIPQGFLFSGLAAFGYAMLFNVPRRAVWACVLCGSASHGVRGILTLEGVDIATATLLCSLLAGLLAHGLARRLALPWTSFAFAGTVAMIPGSYAFRAATGGLHIMAQGAMAPPALVAETLSLAIAAVVLTAAVGIGLLLSSAAAHLLARRFGLTPPGPAPGRR